MKWVTFLHIYQPPNQMADILERVVNESYRPIFRGFLERPQLKFTLNINASLTEQLAQHGYQDVLDMIRTLLERGQCEVTESAKYHPFLPLTPASEVLRQIHLNHETNQQLLGKAYAPKGFFPPEMAYDRVVADVVSTLPYQWILLDEIALSENQRTFDQIYTISQTSLSVFFRHRRVSNLIMSGIVRSFDSLERTLQEELQKDGYILTAMDGETFGHHRPGLDRLLFEFLSSVETAHIQDLFSILPKGPEVEPRACTWASSEEDLATGKQFLSWNDPTNIIHQTQWAFTKWVTHYVTALPQTPEYHLCRSRLDEALHSCQYWWASSKPWWSLEMIEAGAHRLKEVIFANPHRTPEDEKRADDFYQRIVLTAFEWQRTGFIRKLNQQRTAHQRIPLKKQFFNKNDEAGYEGLRALLQEQTQKSSERQEFEQAILWRDALSKLENQMDIFDTLQALDLLRLKLPSGDIDAFLKKFRNHYQQIRSGSVEQRD